MLSVHIIAQTHGRSLPSTRTRMKEPKIRTPHIEQRVMMNGLLVSPAPRRVPERTIASICGTWIKARIFSRVPPSSITC